MRVATAFLLSLLVQPAWAQGRTIVGEWGASPQDCGTTAAWRIGARQIVQDEMSCVFAGVSRAAETVTFTGRCSDGGESVPETVVATRDGDRLAVRFLKGGGRVDLVACPRGSVRAR